MIYSTSAAELGTDYRYHATHRYIRQTDRQYQLTLVIGPPTTFGLISPFVAVEHRVKNTPCSN